MGHRFDRIEYTVFEIPEHIAGREWQWCYSAKRFGEELRRNFLGKTIQSAYVSLGGYLESAGREKDMISCEASGCIVVFENAALQCDLCAMGEFAYRIVPLECLGRRATKDYPPKNGDEIYKCYFDLDHHDLSVHICNRKVTDIFVPGTDLRMFRIAGFDEGKAEKAASEKDLPGEICLCTDAYTFRLIGSDIEYFCVKIASAV